MDGDGCIIMLAIIIGLAVLAAIFAYLWQKEKNNNRFIVKDKEPKIKEPRKRIFFSAERAKKDIVL